MHELILFLAALGLATTYQFYHGRRRNLELIRESIRVIESKLRPIDKEYVVIGLYVGYTAYYRVRGERIKRVAVTVTLLPRQSLLYIPFSLAIRRGDKLYIVYEYDVAGTGEVHLARSKRLLRGVRNSEHRALRFTTEDINDVRFYALYDRVDLLKHLRLLVESVGANNVEHIAVTSNPPRFYIASRLPHNTTELARIVSEVHNTALRIVKVL